MRLWEQQPQAMADALARHDALLREAISAHNGDVFKTVGDAFCVVFADPADALRAALMAQQRLTAEDWNPLPPLRVRMALHCGEAYLREGDYFGPPINRLARLLAAGHGGQTLVSQAARTALGEALPPDAALQDRAAYHLRDVSQPERIFQLLHPSLPIVDTPLRSLQAFAHNLPLAATGFIGREAERKALKSRLQTARCVTITGMGGVGKTRLALQTAADLEADFTDGVWLVELAALSDPEMLLPTLARTLGIREEAERPLMETVLASLKPRALLLTLDNCEHLAATCAFLSRILLGECPRLQILATSRRRLNIAEEMNFYLPPLPLPDLNTPSEWEQSDAVHLFAERAAFVQPSFALGPHNLAAVAQLCRRLDGIPLAIELAAAWTRALPITQITTRLDDRFRLLTGGSSTVLPRQQTLRALLDWSYDLLTEAEQILFRQLSVFAGGWSLEAAEEVCGEERGNTLDGLLSLVDKSLVIYEEGMDGTARYRLLETVRQYSQKRRQELPGEWAGSLAEARHFDYFLALAEQAEPHLRGQEQQRWVEQLEAEDGNLSAALSWCQMEAGRTEQTLRLAGALWRFWSLRGRFSEGRNWLRAGLSREITVEPPVRAKALIAAGALAQDQSDFTEARDFYRQGLAGYEMQDDHGGMATAFNNLGSVAQDCGQWKEAAEHFQRSLAVWRTLGNQHGVAVTLGNLGSIAQDQGDWEAAQALQEESLLLRRALGDTRGVTVALSNLAAVYHALAAPAQARRLLEESLALCRHLGDKPGTALALNNLGLVLSESDREDEALVMYRESLYLFQEMEDREGIACVLDGWAKIIQKYQNDRDAVQLWSLATSLRRSIGLETPEREQAEMAAHLEAARQRIGETQFREAQQAGETQSWPKIVAQLIATPADLLPVRRQVLNQHILGLPS